MDKTKKYEEVLDEQILTLLGDAPSALSTVPEGLRERVMQRVGKDIAGPAESFHTVRDRGGAWIEIAPEVTKKTLYLSSETGTESYLLRMAPGSEVKAHFHDHDEHCLVLEGELMFEDVHLLIGDYHLARAGSMHSIARSPVGALVYIQTGQQGHHLAG